MGDSEDLVVLDGSQTDIVCTSQGGDEVYEVQWLGDDESMSQQAAIESQIAAEQKRKQDLRQVVSEAHCQLN